MNSSERKGHHQNGSNAARSFPCNIPHDHSPTWEESTNIRVKGKDVALRPQSRKLEQSLTDMESHGICSSILSLRLLFRALFSAPHRFVGFVCLFYCLLIPSLTQCSIFAIVLRKNTSLRVRINQFILNRSSRPAFSRWARILLQGRGFSSSLYPYHVI